ncbi:MAG: TetR/AcrR family transcriptional regulator [Alphaproteobacteria bacterium]|nr:TetR/AcrR family transcriptional regulator [Alphaproteobacteria bacterium]
MSELDVRERIIVEATRLLADQGYARTSVREITDAVGVTKPTLYYHFGSKEGLFTALVEHHTSEWLSAAERIVGGEGTVVQRLRRYVRSSFRVLDERPDVLRFLIMAFHQAGQGAPEIDSMRFHAAEVNALLALLKEGVEAGELVQHDVSSSIYLLMGSIHMRIGGALRAGHALEPDTADAIVDLFLHGVKS